MSAEVILFAGVDQRAAVIERHVLAPLREACALALYGISRTVGVIIDKTESQLTEMTRCEPFPEGLDFATDEGSGRYVLYRHREEIQRHYGLYFIGVPNAGLKFTVHPLVGMQWRENEFDDRAKSAARQLGRMWGSAAVALGNRSVAKLPALLKAVEERAAMLDAASAVIQSGIVVEFAPPVRHPESRRQQKREVDRRARVAERKKGARTA